MSAKVETPSAEARFVERMGQIMQEAGLSRIAGQILAALFVAEGPVAAYDLIDRLQISKGSLSTNIRLLELLFVVERRSKPGERQDYFSIRENPYAALIESQIRRSEKSVAVVAEARASITGERAQKKLADLEHYYTLYGKSSKDLLRTLDANKK